MYTTKPPLSYTKEILQLYKTSKKIYYIVTLQRKVKIKFSHYRPSVGQRVGRGIALFFHDRGTRRG